MAGQASPQPSSGHREVTLERTATGTYRARNARGVELELGSGEGMFSPVELLLAAIGGCTAIDVDVVTARRSEAEQFTVTVGAERIVDELGGARLQDVVVDFRVRFPQDEAGAQAQRLVPRLARISHDRDCTVSRTVEHPTRVSTTLDGQPLARAGGPAPRPEVPEKAPTGAGGQDSQEKSSTTRVS